MPYQVSYRQQQRLYFVVHYIFFVLNVSSYHILEKAIITCYRGTSRKFKIPKHKSSILELQPMYLHDVTKVTQGSDIILDVQAKTCMYMP